MHILLALLGSVVTILVLLYRLADIGIDLGGLNPFATRRQRQWRRQFDANPIYTLTDPRAIAAVLLTGAAKIDGDLSAAEKQSLLGEFQTHFSMSPAQASELLSSTVYLLGDMQVIHQQLDEMLSRYRERLAEDQIASLLPMLERIAAVDGPASAGQEQLLAAIREAFATQPAGESTWG